MGKSRVLVDIQGRPPRGYKRFIKICGEKIFALMNLDYNCELSVLLTDDKVMRKLNYDYRKLDETTDVLSFSMNEGAVLCSHPSKKYRLLGDIVISIEKADAQAQEQHHSLKTELGLLLAHGILHLLGYDDVEDDERLEMQNLGAGYVSQIDVDAIM